MDELKNELFSKLQIRISNRIEESLQETYDLIYDAANKYTYRDDMFSDLDPSQIKLFISRCFSGIINTFIPDLLYTIRVRFNSINSDNINQLLSSDEIEYLLSSTLTKQINLGFMNYENEFGYFFKDECLPNFRNHIRNNINFSDSYRMFVRYLTSRLDEIIGDFKNRVNFIVTREIDEVKEECIETLKKEEKNKDKKEEKVNPIVEKLYQDNKDIIESDPLLQLFYQQVLDLSSIEKPTPEEEENLKKYMTEINKEIELIKKEHEQKTMKKFTPSSNHKEETSHMTPEEINAALADIEIEKLLQ